MLSLTDDLMDAVRYGGTTYKINLSFDRVIQYLELAENDDLSEDEKFDEAVELFFENQKLPDDYVFFEYAFKAINDEISNQPYRSEVNSTGFDGSIQPQKYLSYSQDAGAIYASFYQQYHIDLLKERGKMHWSVFQALFDGLGENTPIQRIIDIRQKSPSEVPTDQQGKLLSLQSQFALHLHKSSKKQSIGDVFASSAMQSAFNSLIGEAWKGG